MAGLQLHIYQTGGRREEVALRSPTKHGNLKPLCPPSQMLGLLGGRPDCAGQPMPVSLSTVKRRVCPRGVGRVQPRVDLLAHSGLWDDEDTVVRKWNGSGGLPEKLDSAMHRGIPCRVGPRLVGEVMLT